MSLKEFRVGIDLKQNELTRAVLHNKGTTPPPTPKKGQVYYDIDDDTPYIWNGAIWLDMAQQGVTDGDYGDITVSGSGTTWTIDDNVVTYAKMQNVSTNGRILGNIVGDNTDVQELTAAEVLTLLGVEAGANNYIHFTGGVDLTGGPLSGATVISDVNVNSEGHVTGFATRALTPGDIGAAADTITQYTDAMAEDAAGALMLDSGTIDFTYVPNTSITGIVIDDSITYAKLQNAVADNVFLGNNNGAGTAFEELTGTQATAMLNLFSTSTTTQGLVPGSNGAGSGVFLDATGSWSTPAGGFADFTAGGDTNVDQTVDTGDLLDIVGGTGLTTTVTKAATTVTLSVALDDTAVTAATYGSASIVPVFTVDSQGRITNAVDTTIAIPASQINDIITSDTLAGATDTTVASASAIVSYVTNLVSGQLIYSGGYDATAAPPTGAGVKKGFTYTVTVAGNGAGFFAETLQVGDVIISEQDNPTADAHWTQVNKNIPDIVNASVTAKGLVEEATEAEIAAGTGTGGSGARLFVNPESLAAYLGTDDTDLSPARRFTLVIGNGVLTSIPVTHDLGNQFVTAQLIRNSSPYDEVECVIEHTSTTVTTFVFNDAPTTDEFVVVIVG